MKLEKVAEINRRLSLYENKISEGIGNNQIRDSFKCWSIKTIETLSKEEVKEIKPKQWFMCR